MARRWNGYLLRVVCHKSPLVDHFFPLICINNSSDNLLSTVTYHQLFADDTSLFPVVNDSNISANQLNKDLEKISEWVYKWKTSNNPNVNKQAQEVIFTRKLNKSSHPKIFFNNTPVVHVKSNEGNRCH